MTNIARLDNIIIPDWSAPKTIKALVTTRIGGVSQEPFASFNLATHVGDDPTSVEKNREILSKLLPDITLVFAEQVHGDHLVLAENVDQFTKADALFTQKEKIACGVLTADCLPIFLTNKAGDFVAVIHAGWRGLADGVIEKSIKKIINKTNDLMAWIGPAISQPYFEIGDDVLYAFYQTYPAKGLKPFFRSNPKRFNHYFFDLSGLAKSILQQCGVSAVSGGHMCTYSCPEKFYSYRRDGITGRQASLIWIET